MNYELNAEMNYGTFVLWMNFCLEMEAYLLMSEIQIISIIIVNNSFA